MGKFKRWLNNVVQDKEFNYHKPRCPMYGHRITVIQNTSGKKYSDCLITYCPFCGEKLKG